MKMKRPSVAKSTAQAASGGVIVVVALLALMFFKGVGTGTSSSDPAASVSQQPSLATTKPVSTTPLETPSSTPSANTADDKLSTGGLTQDEQKALSGKILGVLIDEREYLMEIPSEDKTIFRPTSLERLVELARLADGDTNGIRVRILQRETARPSAEQILRNQLVKVGIGSDAIYLSGEFVQ